MDGTAASGPSAGRFFELLALGRLVSEASTLNPAPNRPLSGQGNRRVATTGQ